MDKRMIKMTVAMLGLFLAYQGAVGLYYKTHPNVWTPQQKQAYEEEQKRLAATREAPEQAAVAPNATPTTGATTQSSIPQASSAPAAAQGKYRVAAGSNSYSVQLGSTDKTSPYVIGMSIQPTGAALESVTLNRFLKDVRDKQIYTFQQPYPEPSPLNPAMATRAVVINGAKVDLESVQWSLEPGSSADTAKYSVVIEDSSNGSPVLKIFKQYTVKAANNIKKPEGEAYEVNVDYKLENQTDQQLKAQLIFNGTNVPRPENRNDMVYVVAGYDDPNDKSNNKVVLVPGNFSVGDLSAKTPEKDVKHEKNYFMLWTGMVSAYFDAIVRQDNDLANNTLPMTTVKAIALNPEADPQHRHAALDIQTIEGTIAPKGSAQLPLTVFLGPKLRDIVKGKEFASYPRGFDKVLVFTSGPCAFCTSDNLIDALVWLLRFFHDWLVHDWGLSIILLVGIVRTLLHPITKKSQISMSKFAKMGPEMERLKKKYADDPDELKRLQAELIKEQGMTPILGCLPMFLQMPIWIALWQSLQTTFELRHAPFLWGFTWIKDLSQPDHLFLFSKPIPLFLFGWQLDAINLLPILLAIVFFIQQKMTPKPPTTTPEQAQQQKMMQWMSLLFPVFLYNGPSGLNLYIFTSTTIGIIESKIIRDHIKEREEAEKTGKVLVDAGPTRASKKLAKDGTKKEPKKKGGISGWLADLQAKAEDLRREQDKNRGKGKP